MDWRRLSMELALVDRKISERGAAIVERTIREAGVVDREEAEFLVRLKRAAVSAPAAFDRLVCEVIKQIVLMDGVINAAEVHWLRRVIFADQMVTATELEVLEELRREARSACPEFEALYRACKFSPDFSRG